MVDAPIQGTAELDGEPDSLAQQVASLLAKGNLGLLGPLRITPVPPARSASRAPRVARAWPATSAAA